MTKAFPKKVFVRREDDGDGSTFLTVSDNPDDADHGEEIAIYQLVSTARMCVTKELV